MGMRGEGRGEGEGVNVGVRGKGDGEGGGEGGDEGWGLVEYGDRDEGSGFVIGCRWKRGFGNED